MGFCHPLSYFQGTWFSAAGLQWAQLLLISCAFFNFLYESLFQGERTIFRSSEHVVDRVREKTIFIDPILGNFPKILHEFLHINKNVDDSKIEG